MAKKTKVEKMGNAAEIMAHQLRKQGESTREIATALSRVFGDNISHQGVSNYFDQNKERMARMGEQNAQELERQKHEQLIEIESQMERVNSLLNDLIQKFEDDGVGKEDIGWLTQLSKEIRNQGKFIKKYLQETHPDVDEINNTQINMNVENKTQIAMKITEHLDKLEEDGVITIHEPHRIGGISTDS